jgi:hypothetical protein
MTTPEYPEWICHLCGEKYGHRIPKEATWHWDECDVCGDQQAVTEPRDFGHLKPEWKKHKDKAA